MNASDPRRDGDDDLDEFVETQDTGYEPAPTLHDEDDLPVNEDELDDDAPVPDDERRVPIDPDDAEIL
ncbi:hypothetical protein ACFVWR_14840 [Leifsonia sp. NPDC058292]|uniref:hypothetical protein n=1 Tax=Leifsonia sp. NPDC058292 TaxID=3346428 RepID=UPI0036DC006C